MYIFLGSYTLKSDTLKIGSEYIFPKFIFFLSNYLPLKTNTHKTPQSPSSPTKVITELSVCLLPLSFTAWKCHEGRSLSCSTRCPQLQNSAWHPRAIPSTSVKWIHCFLESWEREGSRWNWIVLIKLRWWFSKLSVPDALIKIQIPDCLVKIQIPDCLPPPTPMLIQ